MRVALVTEFYYPHLGGVTEHVYNLARLLNRSGHRAIIITSHMATPSRAHDLDEVAEEPLVIHRVGTSRVIYSYGSFARITTGLGLRRQIRDILRAEQIDLLHVHGGLGADVRAGGARCGRRSGNTGRSHIPFLVPPLHLMPALPAASSRDGWTATPRLSP